MKVDLGNRVALITGGGSGIGQATAIRLAAAGARVAVLSRTREELEETVRQVETVDSEGLVLVADISRAEEMQAAIEKIVEQWGRLDIVFANAGINGVWAPIGELSPEEWQKTIDVNLTGTFLTIKYAVPLLRQNGGSVTITASVNGTRIFSNTGATAYSSSKAGQVALAKMLALELASDRIRVNVICPGGVETEIGENTEKQAMEGVGEPVKFPAGHIPLTDGAAAQPEQVAELVLFLSSAAANHITGTEIWIDGAESLLQG